MFLKKSLFAQGEFGLPFLSWISFPPYYKFLMPKFTKKCCHIGILEVVVLWLLVPSMKAQ
jgi:hypothetical protein